MPINLEAIRFFFFVIPVCGLSSLTKQFAGLPSRGASSTSQTSFGGNNLLSFMFIFHLPWFFLTPNFLWLDHLMLNLPLWCLRGCVETLRRWFSISPTSLMDNVTPFEDPVYGGFSSLYGRQEHVFTQSWGKCSFCKDINYIHFSVFQSWSQHFV